MSMKPFRSPLKMPGGGEIQRCFYPLRLDTYGRGCSHDCLYCYSKSVLSFRGLWGIGAPAVFADIEKRFDSALLLNRPGKYNDLLRRRIPVRLGGMTDCFGAAEREHGITRKVLGLLRQYRYPYLILTKSASIADYLDVLDPTLAYVQFSITTPYDDIARIYEPGASVTSERLAACRSLADAGVYTAARINPLFPIYRDGYFSRGEESERLRYFDWSLVDMIAAAGAQTLIAGFLRLSSWNLRWIEERTRTDLRWLFDAGTDQRNQALHFSTEEKRYYYEELKRRCDVLGMEFSVCYDGDDAFEEFRYLWANPEDCCNGLGNVAGFEVTFDAVRRR